MTEPRSPDRAGSRRRLLVSGLALAGAYAGLRVGLPALSDRFAPLDFAPLARPPGFRRLLSSGGASGGGSAGAFDPLVGLELAADRVAPSCAGLFEGEHDPGTVPVAYFSDYNCAYCRVLSPLLDRLEGVRITLHELPILGESSRMAARAALAAREQDAQRQFHDALMAMPRPSPAGIARIANDLGLDLERLNADAEAPAVNTALGRSEALAALFGLNATPALIVGRTLVIGAISRVSLDRLVAREIADGPVPACV